MRASTGILLFGAAVGAVVIARSLAARETVYQKPASPPDSGRGTATGKQLYQRIHGVVFGSSFQASQADYDQLINDCDAGDQAACDRLDAEEARAACTHGDSAACAEISTVMRGLFP